jgi:telomerase protein component 1
MWAGTPWQTRPLFVSSTFRDMHAERDHLWRVVFPALEERLRQRCHHLEPVDLCWGGVLAAEGSGRGQEVWRDGFAGRDLVARQLA